MLHKFMRKLLVSPDDLKEHLRYIFAATMMKVLYNIGAQENGDELVSVVDEAISRTATLATGVHPVEIFPFLRHLPSWVPGTDFHDAFAKCRAAVEHLKETPFATLNAALNEGRAAPCGISVLLSKLITPAGSSSENAYWEDVIKNVGLVAFEAGADTSFSTLQAVFLAMSLYPNVLKTAQAELDAVVGSRRLPDYGDRDELPYVNAIIKEALRWHVVLPLSLPHNTVADDELDGYFIPAGTIIMPNTWAMLHDPEVFEDPEEFRPERFLRDDELDDTARDPYAFAFGYGRRQVP
ncbi:cytochrome P450 [Trametes versicolor FP-101664 SS1]|uniref:cytochrome P450 n=1 Tax=Trametes versicolor (strain FP-101664) TaxID=717944 RepID=UPI0004621CED|nr:cytochrome P450 [Trametes versicolor FP-101664 SS1]EIW59175.1 cytochrome P450 [Trametes versicolor FP-101664 SS1]